MSTEKIPGTVDCSVYEKKFPVTYSGKVKLCAMKYELPFFDFS